MKTVKYPPCNHCGGRHLHTPSCQVEYRNVAETPSVAQPYRAKHHPVENRKPSLPDPSDDPGTDEPTPRPFWAWVEPTSVLLGAGIGILCVAVLLLILDAC